MEQRRRIINFRSFLIVAVSMIIAILGTWLYFVFEVYGFLVLFLLFSLLIGLMVYYVRINAPIFKRVTFLISILFCVVAIINFNMIVSSQTFASANTVSLISGKVDTVDFDSGDIVLDSILLNGLQEDGKVRISVDFASYQELYALRVGDVLVFETRLTPNPIMAEGAQLNVYAFRTGIKYRCYEFLSASEEPTPTFVIQKEQANFSQKVREEIREMLVLAMGAEHGGVAYGMFIGDTSGIGEEMSSAYSVSGMAHTLSVSGLHIGFLSAALLFILKLLRVRQPVSGIVTILLLWVYAIFTGLAPPVLRAVIMATILLASRMAQRRYDALNSLSAAVTIILLVFPLYLFDIGFLLSVTAVLGIIFFAKRITDFLIRIYVPKYFAKLLGVTTAAQIGFLPAMIFGMRGIQTYALFMNVLLLPIIGFAFSVMLVGLLLAAIIRPLLFILQFVGFLLAIVDTFILSAAKLPFAVLYVVPSVGAGIFLAYVLYFAASRFLIQKKGKRRLVSRAGALALSVVLCFSGIFTAPRYDAAAYVAAVNSYGDVTSVVRHEGRVYVIGDVNNFYALDQTLTALRVHEIDAIFLSNLNEKTAREVLRVSYAYRIGQIYAYKDGDLSGIGRISGKVSNFYVYDGTATLASDVAPVVYNKKHLAYELMTDLGSIVFCGYRTNYSNLPLAVVNRSYAIRCFMYQELYPERIFLTNMERGYKSMDIPRYQFTLQDDDSFIFDFSSGNLAKLPT